MKRKKQPQERLEPRVVSRETTIIRADERAYWREDEKFPKYVLIETAIRMWLRGNYVLRPEIDRQHLADNICEKNSELIGRAASIYADMIEKGQLEIYDGVLSLPVRGERRANILSVLRDFDPLSRIHLLDAHYFNGRKLYEAVVNIIPWGNPVRDEEDDDLLVQIPTIWWDLKDNSAPKSQASQIKTVTRTRIKASLTDIDAEKWRGIFSEETKNGLVAARVKGTTRLAEYDAQKFVEWLINHRKEYSNPEKVAHARQVFDGKTAGKSAPAKRNPNSWAL